SPRGPGLACCREPAQRATEALPGYNNAPSFFRPYAGLPVRLPTSQGCADLPWVRRFCPLPGLVVMCGPGGSVLSYRCVFHYPCAMNDEPSSLTNWTREQITLGKRWV